MAAFSTNENYVSDDEDEYEYYDSDEEYSSSGSEDQVKDENQITSNPQNSFVNDILFTLYNDYIMDWNNDQSKNLDVVTNLTGLLNFIETYSKNKQDNGIKIVYHGTTEHAISCIRETMFIVPNGKDVKVRNGSVYGNGVYCSESIEVAKGYSTNNKLIVCLLAPGKINTKSPFINSDKYDTNYCEYSKIICTFDSKNICPLFIIDKFEVEKISDYTEIIKGFIENVFELTSERQFI